MKLSALLLLSAVGLVSASCPNDCNGHGTCNVYSACECYRNWMAADCSERVCYFGHAFVDTPQGDLNADGRTDLVNATYRVIISSDKSFFAEQDNDPLVKAVRYLGRAAPDWHAVTGKTAGVTKSSISFCGTNQDCSGTPSDAFPIENDITVEYTLDTNLSSYASYQSDDIYGYVEACDAVADASVKYAIAFDVETTAAFESALAGVATVASPNVEALVLTCADAAGSATACAGTGADHTLVWHASDRQVEVCSAHPSTYQVQWSNKKEWEAYPTDHGMAMTGNKNVWDEAHFYRECSNKGTCNRGSGSCECYAGYEGEGCSRTSCPNDCSGHGTCVRPIDVDDAYIAWDAYKTQSCRCDSGYHGPDCSLRSCPSGDDPISRINDRNEIQKFTLKQRTKAFDKPGAAGRVADSGNGGAGLFIALDFTDEFGDHWITRSVDITSSVSDATAAGADIASRFEQALEALPNNVLEDVEVSATRGTDAIAVSVTFLHNTGDIPMLGARYSFSASSDTSAANGSLTTNTAVGGFDQTNIEVVQLQVGNKENVSCSNRGLCDTGSGLCKCFAGYTDYDCSVQNALSSS
jgi:hypothetical protein